MENQPLNKQLIADHIEQIGILKKKDGFTIEKIHLFESIDSTNTFAKQFAQNVEPLLDTEGILTQEGHKIQGSVFIAEEQTAGRGRIGRSFFSPKGTGLYFSIIFVANGGIKKPALITAAAAVGVCRSLNQCFNIYPKIKWVNDLFLQEKKIGGILTEGVISTNNSFVQAAIIGVGLNICTAKKDFPTDVANVAGSLFSVDGSDINRNFLAASVASNVYQCVAESFLGNANIIDEYRKHSLFNKGQILTIFPVATSPKNAYKAIYEGVDQEGRLKITLLENKKKQVLSSGEVSLHSEHFTN